MSKNRDPRSRDVAGYAFQTEATFLNDSRLGQSRYLADGAIRREQLGMYRRMQELQRWAHIFELTGVAPLAIPSSQRVTPSGI